MERPGAPVLNAITTCPACGTTGRAVQPATLKGLLTPAATLKLGEAHRFCPDPARDVVYFSASQIHRQAEVKVPVFQKDGRGRTPVCYCFGHTCADLEQATREGGAGAIPRRSRRTSRPHAAGARTIPREAAAWGI